MLPALPMVEGKHQRVRREPRAAVAECELGLPVSTPIPNRADRIAQAFEDGLKP
jgi:hypothetical protein